MTPPVRFDDVKASGRLKLVSGALRSERKEMKWSAQSWRVQYPSAPSRTLDWNSFTVSRLPRMNVMVRFFTEDARLTPRSRAAARTEACTDGASLEFPWATRETVLRLTLARRATSANF